MDKATLVDTGLRVTLVNGEDEPYVGPAPVMKDQFGNLYVIDDDDDVALLSDMMRDAQEWAHGK